MNSSHGFNISVGHALESLQYTFLYTAAPTPPTKQTNTQTNQGNEAHLLVSSWHFPFTDSIHTPNPGSQSGIKRFTKSPKAPSIHQQRR